MKLINSIVIQFIIGLLIGIALHLMTGFNIIILCWVGVVGWLLVLALVPKLGGLWFIWPKGNTAIVLEHGLKKQEKLADNQLTSLQPTKTMRVVWGPGLNGKSIFEKPLGGKAVNLQRSIPLKETVTVKLKDGSISNIEWWTTLSVILRDIAIINLARHTEKQAIDKYRFTFNSFLMAECARINDTDALLAEIIPVSNPIPGQPRQLGPLQIRFNNLYGGSGRIIDEELQGGFQTGDPLCTVILTKTVADALQAKAIALKRKEALDVYIGSGISANIAANMVANDAGVTAPSVANSFEINLPPGVTVFQMGTMVDGRSK